MRTIFNVLGPLTNPAGALRQVIGVFAPDLVEPLARVLGELGSEHVMVVHSEDGLDELSLGAPTRVAELRDGTVRTYALDARDLGFTRAPVESITVDSPAREPGHHPRGAGRRAGTGFGHHRPQCRRGRPRERHRVEPGGRYRTRAREHRLRSGRGRPGAAGGDQQ